MKNIFFSSFVLCSLLGTLHAQDAINFDLSLKAGLTSLDNEDGWDFSKGTLAVDGVFDLGYVIKPRIDMVYVNVDESRGSVDSLWQIALDGQYDFELDSRFAVEPYLFGGLGYEYVSGSREGFDNQFFLQGGAGIKYPVNKNFSVVGEFKALQMIDTSKNDEENEFVVLIGATMPFHIQTQTKVLDEDGDGVLNADDLCPNTPSGITVNADGCPVVPKRPVHKLPVPAEAVQVQHATQIEKVVPMEASEPKIEKAVSDSDHDGVPDNIDECADTPAGFSVDSRGCGVKKRLEVHFESNAATLTPESKQKIKAFASYLKRMPKVTVTIEGYTDSSGTLRQNMRLSQLRANAVKQALVSYGVSPDRITAVGKGPLNPIAENDTPEGRAKNRRIEAIIHNQGK